jgi:hypothetical protein
MTQFRIIEWGEGFYVQGRDPQQSSWRWVSSEGVCVSRDDRYLCPDRRTAVTLIMNRALAEPPRPAVTCGFDGFGVVATVYDVNDPLSDELLTWAAEGDSANPHGRAKSEETRNDTGRTE